MSVTPWKETTVDYPYIIDRKVLDSIQNEVSGERSWDMVSQISRFHRVRGGGEGSGFNQCVDWLAGELRKLGLDSVEVKKFRSDGFSKYFQWTSLTGWREREAELWLIEPNKRLLARYSDQPLSLMLYSRGGEVESDVVYVGSGKSDGDYEGKDVKGKLVFAVGGGGPRVHREAVLRRGAAGVIVGPSDREDRRQFPELIEEVRLSPVGVERDKVGFGFSISKRLEREILLLFESKQKVMMRARVDAEIIDGDMPVLEATMKGGTHPSQEIIVMGHLDHYKPGANDNASGCAGMVEIIRNIKALVERGVIPSLRRTLRFLWVPEMHGTVAYLAENMDIGERGIAGMNLDMIGEDSSKCQSIFNLTCSPYSVQGYINDVLTNLLPWLEEEGFYSPKGSRNKFNYRVKHYSGGSDHFMFDDSTFSISSTMLGHSDVFHHTNFDDTDACDPTEMKRIIGLAEAACILLANADDGDALAIAGEVYGRGSVRMAERTEKSIRLLNQRASERDGRSRLSELHANLIRYPELQAKIESSNIMEVRELCQEAEGREAIETLAKDILRHAETEKEKIERVYELLVRKYDLPEEDPVRADFYKRACAIRPVRLFKGPLNSDWDRSRFIWDEIREGAGKERADWYEENKDKAGGSLDAKVFEMVNLMDGQRTLLDVRHLVSCEFDETDIEYVLHFAEDLEKLGLISS